jgi:hypothetical protein
MTGALSRPASRNLMFGQVRTDVTGKAASLTAQTLSDVTITCFNGRTSFATIGTGITRLSVKAPTEGSNVDEVRRSGAKLVLVRPDGPQTRRQAPRGPAGLAYSLVSAALGTATGLAVSLVATGTARLVIWCAVAGALCVGAGLVSRSAAITACRSACRGWLRRLASL